MKKIIALVLVLTAIIDKSFSQSIPATGDRVNKYEQAGTILKKNKKHVVDTCAYETGSLLSESPLEFERANTGNAGWMPAGFPFGIFIIYSPAGNVYQWQQQWSNAFKGFAIHY